MSQHSSVKVVVVGAGLAGLAAAAALVQAGFKDVQILEAMDRPGGRVHTTRPFDNNKIEMGANWIHGQKGNPLYALAKKRGFLQDETPVSGTMCLPGSVSPRDYFFHQDGQQIPVNVVKQVRSLFRKLTAKAFECGLDQRYKDFSLGHYLDDAFGRSPLAASEDGRRVYEWCKRSECTDEACSSLYDVSAFPDPVQVLLSKWGTEPYVQGSYSFIPLGVNAVQEQTALAAPLPQTSQKGDPQQEVQHLL